MAGIAVAHSIAACVGRVRCGRIGLDAADIGHEDREAGVVEGYLDRGVHCAVGIGMFGTERVVLAVELEDEPGVGLIGSALDAYRCPGGFDHAWVLGVAAGPGAERPVDAVPEVGAREEHGGERAGEWSRIWGEIEACGVFAVVGDDEPAGAVLDCDLAIDGDREAWHVRGGCFAEDGFEIGQVSEGFGTGVMEAFDDAGVGADGRHDEEASAGIGVVRETDIGVDNAVFCEGAEKQFWVAVHAVPAGDEILVSAGDVIDGGSGADRGIGDGVDRAIAPEGEDGSGALEAVRIELGTVGQARIVEGELEDADAAGFEAVNETAEEPSG